MNKIKIVKIILSIIVIIGTTIALIYLMPFMLDMLTEEGQENFRNKINETGILGLFILIGLQIAQIALVVLPGEPLEILAGMCYGPIWGTIFVLVTSTIMTIIIVWLVNKYGRKLVYEFFNKEKVDKIVDSKIYKNVKRIEFIMLVLFLIPGTPKDLLVYIAGLLPINLFRFVMISTIARIPSIISSTISGGAIVYGNWSIVASSYIITYIVVILLIIVLNKKDKGKTIKIAIKKLK